MSNLIKTEKEHDSDVKTASECSDREEGEIESDSPEIIEIDVSPRSTKGRRSPHLFKSRRSRSVSPPKSSSTTYRGKKCRNSDLPFVKQERPEPADAASSNSSLSSNASYIKQESSLSSNASYVKKESSLSSNSSYIKKEPQETRNANVFSKLKTCESVVKREISDEDSSEPIFLSSHSSSQLPDVKQEPSTSNETALEAAKRLVDMSVIRRMEERKKHLSRHGEKEKSRVKADRHKKAEKSRRSSKSSHRDHRKVGKHHREKKRHCSSPEGPSRFLKHRSRSRSASPHRKRKLLRSSSLSSLESPAGSPRHARNNAHWKRSPSFSSAGSRSPPRKSLKPGGKSKPSGYLSHQQETYSGRDMPHYSGTYGPYEDGHAEGSKNKKYAVKDSNSEKSKYEKKIFDRSQLSQNQNYEMEHGSDKVHKTTEESKSDNKKLTNGFHNTNKKRPPLSNKEKQLLRYIYGPQFATYKKDPSKVPPKKTPGSKRRRRRNRRKVKRKDLVPGEPLQPLNMDSSEVVIKAECDSSSTPVSLTSEPVPKDESDATESASGPTLNAGPSTTSECADIAPEQQQP